MPYNARGTSADMQQCSDTRQVSYNTEEASWYPTSGSDVLIVCLPSGQKERKGSNNKYSKDGLPNDVVLNLSTGYRPYCNQKAKQYHSVVHVNGQSLVEAMR